MVHTLECSAVTDTGLVRQNNQDSYYTSPDLGVVVVADGMGGHQGGEVASAIAVRGIRETLLQYHWDEDCDDQQTLAIMKGAVMHSNALIRKEAAERSELKGMGTTIVVALYRQDKVYYAHVGDSRIYRFRQGKLTQITRDHSLIQELVDTGAFADIQEAATAGIGSNILTRGLGIEDKINVDVATDNLDKGDVFLFCTDGLTNMVPDREIERLLNHYDELDQASQRLLSSAMSAGGVDNITLVLTRVAAQD